MNCLLILHTILLVLVSSLTPLQEFEIDGNYYSNGSTDWSTVLNGYRINRTMTANWTAYQSQCVKDSIIINPSIYNDDYWISQVFCDTFGNLEQSITGSSDDTIPYDWMPLHISPTSYDLTNAYLTANDIDMITCVAIERLNTDGSTYVDFEFSQNVGMLSIAEGCPTQIFNEQSWKCMYPNRTNNDFQISLLIASANSGFTIKVCKWNDSIVFDSGNCGGSYWDQVYEAVSNDGSDISTTVIKGAVNHVGILSSPFKFVENTVSNYYTDVIPVGAFMETCIDWRALNEPKMVYDTVIIKQRSSFGGALEDTSGVISFNMNGNINQSLTHSPTTKLTISPSFDPTYAPSQSTISPNVNPTISPSVNPTYVPSQSTITPSVNPNISPTSSYNPTISDSSAAPTNNPTKNPIIDCISCNPGGDHTRNRNMRALLHILLFVCFCVVSVF